MVAAKDHDSPELPLVRRVRDLVAVLGDRDDAKRSERRGAARHSMSPERVARARRDLQELRERFDRVRVLFPQLEESEYLRDARRLLGLADAGERRRVAPQPAAGPAKPEASP